MGIHGLSKLIGDNAPGAIKEGTMEKYLGHKFAIECVPTTAMTLPLRA